MEKYAQFLSRHRRPLLAVFVVINILALIGIFRIQLDSGFDVFMPENSAYKKVMDSMEEYFSSSENIIFLADAGKQELDLQTVEKFREFQKFLEKHEHIEYVTGPAPEIIASGRNLVRLDTLQVDDLDYLREYYTSMGDIAPVVHHDASVFGVFEAFPDKSFRNEDIHTIEDKLKQLGFSYTISGEIYMQLKVFDYILKILLAVPPAALLLILIVFRFQMRSMKATFFSILPAGIGALWTMGTVGWLGNEVSVVTVLAPIFTVVIGSADGLHFVAHVQEEENRGVKRMDAVVETLRMVGIPMIITTVTSMAGFLALLVMNNSAIKGLALFASLGILMAGAATWYVLPLILTGSVNLRSAKAGVKLSAAEGSSAQGSDDQDTDNQTADDQTAGLREIVPSVKGLKRLWGWPSWALVLLIVGVAALGIPKLTTEFNMLSIYKDYTVVQRGFERTMEINNGSVPLFLYAEYDADPLDPEIAGEFAELKKTYEESGRVGKYIDAYTVMSLMYGNMRGIEAQYPEDMQQSKALWNILSRREENPLEHFIDPEALKSRIIIFPSDLQNQTLDEIEEIADAFNEAHSGITLKPTGAQFLFRELNLSMVKGQVSSILLAFGLIFILLLVFLRDVRAAFFALLPILLTVISLYGAMGLLGLSLNLMTATIFGITIGVGIDYAVHFTSVWKTFKLRGLSSQEAAEKAAVYTARPIITNGAGISIGLSALLFSPLLIHLYVSEMMWVSMIVSAVLSLTWLPTILRRRK
ncbi:MAG: MMPL family transporter [Spirochaetales bacterium]|nr:MMPL family transporter [Spirochaetales bacterium]